MQLRKSKPFPVKQRRAVASERLVAMAPLTAGATLPLLISPCADGVDLPAWAASNVPLLCEKLECHGGLLFRGFAMDTGRLQRFIELFGEPLRYEERSSPRTRIDGQIYTSTEYPNDQDIFFHNENSYQHTWPMKIFFLCQTPPQTDGQTPIADCRAVLGRIDPEIQRRFQTKGIRYVRNFHARLGLAWQTVFQTEERSRVERYCQAHDIAFEWKGDGGLRTASHRSAIESHPESGVPVWFNHGAFFHLSTLAGPVQEALAGLPTEDLPNQTFYGDGSPIEAEVIEHIRQAYRDESVLFDWRKNDLLMLDNMLVAHARASFQGERKIVVGMCQPMTRAGLAERIADRLANRLANRHDEEFAGALFGEVSRG